MKRSIIIALLCMALSTQALAWSAMSCCDGAGAASQTMHHDMQGHRMGDLQAHCGDDGDDGANRDLTTSNCCPGAVCGSTCAVPSAAVRLSAQIWRTDFFAPTRVRPNAPPERLLRPPIT